jgi:hypothetical protein
MALVKYNNNSISAITDVSSSMKGTMTLIKSQTADASSGTVAFVNGSSDVVLDSTYPIYLFKFINIHPNNDGDILRVNFSDDTSSHSYDLAKTTTGFNARHDEDGSDGGIAYSTGTDLAQGTGNKDLTVGVNNANEASCSGEMYLFSPSSTTFVKHFYATTNTDYGGRCYTRYSAGYINTTAAVTAVQFTFTGGNIDAGTFKLYGIKDS